jgi:hypothetical protein
MLFGPEPGRGEPFDKSKTEGLSFVPILIDIF